MSQGSWKVEKVEKRGKNLHTTIDKVIFTPHLPLLVCPLIESTSYIFSISFAFPLHVPAGLSLLGTFSLTRLSLRNLIWSCTSSTSTHYGYVRCQIKDWPNQTPIPRVVVVLDNAFRVDTERIARAGRIRRN